jgi:N-acetylmuramoyl-L-alanine amidase
LISEAILCIALNVYYEARGENRTGQLAVAHVVLNRAQKRDSTVCWETFRAEQFTWTNDMRNLRVLPAGDKWAEAQSIAQEATGTYDFTGGATHYHVVGLHPRWAKGMKKLGRYGAHVFYKE